MFFISGILTSRHYYRGMNAHTIMLDALWRLYWEEFENWLEGEDYLWRLDVLKVNLKELPSEFDSEDVDKKRIQEKLDVSTSKIFDKIGKYFLN